MRKGQKLGFIPIRAFKKGQIPHNKGKIFRSTKICEHCKKEFVIRGKKPALVKKYCSRICAGRSNKGTQSPLKGIPRTEEVKTKIGEKNKGRIFSLKTREKMSFKKIGKHISPNTEFKIGHKAPKTAFIRNDYRLIRENNPNWKDGITPINQKIRTSYEYKEWNKQVFIRDNYTDQKTGIKGGILHAHHVLNFSNNPELRFDINNGITLSEESHREFHRIYGRKNNTREQLNEYINRIMV